MENLRESLPAKCPKQGFQHVVKRHAHSANARLAAALSGLDRDDVLVAHVVILSVGLAIPSYAAWAVLPSLEI
jgi:hypothetical protein